MIDGVICTYGMKGDIRYCSFYIMHNRQPCYPYATDVWYCKDLKISFTNIRIFQTIVFNAYEFSWRSIVQLNKNMVHSLCTLVGIKVIEVEVLKSTSKQKSYKLYPLCFNIKLNDKYYHIAYWKTLKIIWNLHIICCNERCAGVQRKVLCCRC